MSQTDWYNYAEFLINSGLAVLLLIYHQMLLLVQNLVNLVQLFSQFTITLIIFDFQSIFFFMHQSYILGYQFCSFGVGHLFFQYAIDAFVVDSILNVYFSCVCFSILICCPFKITIQAQDLFLYYLTTFNIYSFSCLAFEVTLDSVFF